MHEFKGSVHLQYQMHVGENCMEVCRCALKLSDTIQNKHDTRE